MLKLIFVMKFIEEKDAFSRAFYIMKDADKSLDGRISKQEFIAACSRDTALRELLAPF